MKKGEYGSTSSTPTTVAATLRPAQRLYNDVLHSIFAFLIGPHQPLTFHEFIATASTCTRWMDAAEAMRPVKRNQEGKEDAMQLRQSSNQHTMLACDSHRLESLCYSRLRCHVSSVRYHSRIFPAQLVEMAECMWHLQRLQLDFEFDASSPVDLSSPENNQPAILLPESLCHLIVHLRSRDSFRGAINESEAFGPADEIQSTNQTQCGTIMQALTDGINYSGCKDLSVTCTFETHQSAKLPSCALRPLRSIKSITHLTVSSITVESCDLIREWYASGQLKRLDIVSGVNETTLRRLISGAGSSSTGPKAPTSCPLRMCRVADISYLCYAVLSLLTRFYQLTDLQLVRCAINPCPVLLAHLPALRKFCWRQHPDILVPDLINGITHTAPQLEYLELRCVYGFTEHQLGLLVQTLQRLRSLTLGESQLTFDLSSLSHATSTLEYLHLQEMTIASHESLKHAHRIRHVTVIDCEFLDTPPAPRLVGVELNPGPTSFSLAQSL